MSPDASWHLRLPPGVSRGLLGPPGAPRKRPDLDAVAADVVAAVAVAVVAAVAVAVTADVVAAITAADAVAGA